MGQAFGLPPGSGAAHYTDAVAKHRLYKALLAAAIASFQLFVPPPIGLADNGDFPRLAGRFSLCPEAGWERDKFDYFVAQYRESPACYWDSGIPSSATFPVCAARALDRGPAFDIRALGAVQTALFAGIAAFLPSAALLCFTDVSYVAFFNSFYMDGGALLFCLATIAAAAAMLRGHRAAALAFAVASLLLVTSKTQHAPLALPLGVFLIVFTRPRALAIVGAFALLGAAAFMTSTTPLDYKASNLWNSIFETLLPEAADRDAALEALGLGPEYAPYIGRNAYQFPDMRTAEHWTRALYAGTGYFAMARYYAVHPAEALSRTWRSAAQMYQLRPLYLGNYKREEGRPPRTRTQAFGWWTGAKSWLYHRAPWLAALLYLASGAMLWRSRYRPLLWLLLAMGAIEFALATFADSIVDYRHFFLFHALSDAWLVLAWTVTDFFSPNSAFFQRLRKFQSESSQSRAA